MTTIDLKRAREVADAIESPYPYLHLNEAASLLRSLCERIEQLDSAIAAAGREKA